MAKLNRHTRVGEHNVVREPGLYVIDNLSDTPDLRAMPATRQGSANPLVQGVAAIAP